MRKALLLTGMILFSFSLLAQKEKKAANLPSFGDVKKTELEMKTCSFDDKAEAVVLFDKGELSCLLGQTGVSLELVRHVRIKILQDKGRDAADIHIPFYSYRASEDIKDLSAQTYNLDPSGNIVVTKVEKKSIYEKKLNKRLSEKAFTFPDVRPGSIIEYKYKVNNAGNLDWYFQRSIPVQYSQFTLDFPVEIEMQASPKCSLPYDTWRDQQATRTVTFFSMKEVPALRDEPFILNMNDYLEKIESKPVAIIIEGRRTPITTTWPRVVRTLMEDEDFGYQLKRDIPRTSDLDSELNTVTDPYLRMAAIHRYVRNNMQWNGYYGIWALDGVRSAWKDKKGTVGEINLILVNLLKDAGFKAHPILVSTHSNGFVNTMDPGYNQFDKVLAYVEIGDNTYVLDATEKDTPTNLIPQEVLLTDGLVIEKPETFEWGWKTLWNEKLQAKNVILMQGNIDEKGKMTGEVKINSFDYARLERTPIAKKGTKEFIQKFLADANPGVNIDSVSFENLQNDSLPLIQTVHFNQQLNSSGDYLYFSVNKFTGLEKNPFLADNRISDVFYGVSQFYSIVGGFDIPAGYALEALPKNVKLIMPDTSITIRRVSQADETSILVRITLEFKKPFYPVDEYLDLKEFYKKMEDLLNEQFVFRKKNRP